VKRALREQSQQIKAIQKRDIHIIFNFTRGMPYASMLYAVNINTLASRRHDVCKRFFRGIIQPSSCLHYLLPVPEELSLTAYSQICSKISKNIYICILDAIAHLSIIP